MVDIKKSDIASFQRIGSGLFGTVYRVDEDVAYKIYHITIRDKLGYDINNPCLFMPKYRLMKLHNKKDNILYTDLFDDYINVDRRFGGVKIKYYDGITLKKLMEEPFNLKYDISKQLIRNTKELIDNNIYPMDYRLNNLMYVDDKVKIIDLDDVLTKTTLVTNPYYKRRVIEGLNDTIRSFFNEFDYNPYNRGLYERLLRDKGSHTYKYDEIYNYLENKKVERDYILIDSNYNIESLKEFLSNNDYNVIYLYNNRYYDSDYFSKILFRLENNGIKLYDFIHISDIDKYFNNNNYNNVLELKQKQLIKRK